MGLVGFLISWHGSNSGVRIRSPKPCSGSKPPGVLMLCVMAYIDFTHCFGIFWRGARYRAHLHTHEREVWDFGKQSGGRRRVNPKDPLSSVV